MRRDGFGLAPAERPEGVLRVLPGDRLGRVPDGQFEVHGSIVLQRALLWQSGHRHRRRRTAATGVYGVVLTLLTWDFIEPQAPGKSVGADSRSETAPDEEGHVLTGWNR
ncbi:hypothetical protein Plo01_11190 [Planobispora longispora]|uniref:Uncharacterized protein n=1 Tax=Planobispora longispora TaxID=28887 RepID=A0A8J3W3T4_9ACTN|nr:hypothetical protein Plo01_11190 [Planobispora longispora]